MTEYGRGPGSEPWHPEDPLYGDQGWDGRQAAHGQGQYGDQQQSYPQDPYAQQHQNHQQYQGHQQQPYDQHQQYGQQQSHQHQQQNHQQYGTPQDPYAQQPGAQPQYNGGWDTGQQAAMPYGAEPQDPYAQHPGGYDTGQDYYGTPEAYPPPQPPGRREAAPQQQPQQQQPHQQGSTDWDPDQPQEETHPFFTGADDPAGREPRDDDDDPDDDGSRSSRRDRGGNERRGGKGKKKKSRSGCACLVVSVVLVGGLGGVSYVGYTFWKKQFGAPADYAGSGSSEQVEVEIPEGAFGYDIANILRKQGVIKSSDAFVAAQNDNPKGKLIQAGVYLLNKEMSAASAVTLMLDPKSQNAFVIPEGTRNTTVYKMIDTRLKLKKGTTADIAKTKAESLGLPDWADDNPDVKDPLEGFLYPAAYPVAKGSKPEDALKRMVSRANKEYGKVDLEGSAKKLGLKTPWELITVASLVQVEGKYKHDFDKVARVVYNRLKPGNMETVGRLEFDSTVNYIKGQSTLDIGAVDDLRKIDDPYNTYKIIGLPSGPISNPGADALHSAMNPTPGPWYYFVSINEDKTVFAETNEEHEKNRREYEDGKAGQ
ncbi:endolytic transglycosylase MltG [Streptomyces sp. MBT67]|uniref:endolytic transglycosylase MltG n=1 Tax=unclassified Streptomyces TaxID=2593676 RepID=UPI00190D8211|nr:MULTISPECIES: endolytic transglycosylase MltG [unclassified Streptomyces]MBK3533996.1 endolytic transglycosylase MltG [Streptomyces sp. MBT72]MBK3540614.1 endolytic transglycosylase MltG [Streptomyces sp. MBT67]MBK3552318.1 endolytic transglycosylase MltG [Streptomyces sp. MBT61]MBK6031876.1 endolytic transglycosylase MltG [Streptomyces sp. MBT59]